MRKRKEGKKHGQGQFLFADGSVFTGVFADDHFTERGQFIFKDGSVFEGKLSFGRPSGKGVVVFADHSKYYGHFSEGVDRGKGVFISGSGDRYKGEIKNHLPFHMKSQLKILNLLIGLMRYYQERRK